MSKNTAKDSVTAASIEEQTAAFLKAGGAIEYVTRGKTGQIAPAGPRRPAPKKS